MERQRQLQETDKAKANQSSLPYDPITLMYDDGTFEEEVSAKRLRTRKAEGADADDSREGETLATESKHDPGTAAQPGQHRRKSPPKAPANIYLKRARFR